MLVLLPPSETKRPGGRRTPLALDRLALPELRPQREAVIDALVTLSADPVEAARVLKLSPRQVGDVAANATLRTGPTLPAIDRYTGVVYDALDAGTLDPRLVVGWVATSSSTRPPSARSARSTRSRPIDSEPRPSCPVCHRCDGSGPTPVAAALLARAEPFVLDLRSEAYVALGPVPDAIPSAYVRVVGAGEDGTVRALNHFNKATKGALVRTLAQARPTIRTLRGLLRWASTAGIALTRGPDGVLLLRDRGVGAMTYAPAMTLTGGWARLARAGVFGGASLFLATAGHVVGGGTLPGAGLLALTAIGLALLSVTLTSVGCGSGCCWLPSAWSSSCSTCSSTPPPRRRPVRP